MNLKQTVSAFVLALNALTSAQALADPGSYSVRAVDHYAGSTDEQVFKAGLRTMGNAQLVKRAFDIYDEVGLSCAASGVVVGFSAAAETLPILGVFPRIFTHRTFFWNSSENYDDVQSSGFLGGGVMAVLGTIRIPFSILVNGEAANKYAAAKAAYWGTSGLAADLFWRDSACRKTLDRLHDIKAEITSRGTSAKAEAVAAENQDAKTARASVTVTVTASESQSQSQSAEHSQAHAN